MYDYHFIVHYTNIVWETAYNLAIANDGRLLTFDEVHQIYANRMGGSFISTLANDYSFFPTEYYFSILNTNSVNYGNPAPGADWAQFGIDQNNVLFSSESIVSNCNC